jgi:hypothetical protein
MSSSYPPDALESGLGGVWFFTDDTLDDEQGGYAGPGWQPGWLVIGREGVTDDPVFVDRDDPLLPVMTARHGMGRWDPQPVAPGWDAFVRALAVVRPYTVNREHPVGLEENALSDEESSRLHRETEAVIGAPLPAFWLMMFASPAL